MHQSGSNGRKDIVFSRSISATLRAEALHHAGFTCHMCGLGPGEIDAATGRKARLRIEYPTDNSLGGKNKISNLWATCSICTQGSQEIATEKPSGLWLLSQVRRAGQEEQREILNSLLKKFKD